MIIFISIVYIRNIQNNFSCFEVKVESVSQIIFTSIYIFHLFITLTSVSSQPLLCFSITLHFRLCNLSGYVISLSPVKQSKPKKNPKNQQYQQPKKHFNFYLHGKTIHVGECVSVHRSISYYLTKQILKKTKSA